MVHFSEACALKSAVVDMVQNLPPAKSMQLTANLVSFDPAMKVSVGTFGLGAVGGADFSGPITSHALFLHFAGRGIPALADGAVIVMLVIVISCDCDCDCCDCDACVSLCVSL